MNKKFERIKKPSQLSDRMGKVRIVVLAVGGQGRESREIKGNYRGTLYVNNAKVSEVTKAIEEALF